MNDAHDDRARNGRVHVAALSENESIVCDLSAIPADERSAHIALARHLFGAHPIRELEDSVEVELSADRLGDAAAFIRNERLCCRHLAFAIEVPARETSIVLRVAGPGAMDELRALIR